MEWSLPKDSLQPKPEIQLCAGLLHVSAEINWSHLTVPGVHSFSVRVESPPVNALYWGVYQLRHSRAYWMSEAELDDLFRTRHDLATVYARMGGKYRWHDHGDYNFWEHVARGRVISSSNLPPDLENPRLGYWASFWCVDQPQDDVVLFEASIAKSEH
ncbi:MAG: hypothetical protein AAF585_19770 [Verrucomicrobiota bacterium]